MQSIDVLVVPTLWGEPFGLVAVEGCANNLPVIASNMGGLPEIIRDDCKGLLCSTDDPDSLGIGMPWLHISSDLRPRTGRQERAGVVAMEGLERRTDHET